MPCIGIDFGTTASKMAWFDPRAGQAQVLVNAEGELRTPSVVYVGNDGLLVGGQAEQMFQFAEERKRVVLSIKRNLVQTPQLYLANRPIRALDIAAAILHKLKTDAEELYFHQPVRQAVITYPASFNVLQRDKIAEAGRLAGFEQVAMLAEPIAAALAYAHAGLTVGNRLLVYDLGGGTFDVALLAREDGSWRLAMPAKGLNYCGGDDFDRSLYTFCDERALAEVGGRISDGDQLDLAFLRLCRQRKETLSTQSKATFSTLVTVNGWETRFEQVIDRPTFNGLIGDRVRATVTLTQETMADPAAGSVDTVVLVGGSSRVPLVEELLTVALQKPPLKWGNRDHAVALGAAYHAQTLWADSGPVNGREQEAPPPTSVPAPRPPVERTPAPQPAPQPATTTVVAPERPPPALSNQDLSNQALSAAQAGNLPEAERLLTQLLERDPPHFDAATRLAAIRQQRAGPPQPPPAPQPTPHRPAWVREMLVLAGSALLFVGTLLPWGLEIFGGQRNLWKDGFGIGPFLLLAVVGSVLLTIIRPFSRFTWVVGGTALVSVIAWPLVAHSLNGAINPGPVLAVPILGALTILVTSGVTDVLRPSSVEKGPAANTAASETHPSTPFASPPRLVVGLAGALILLAGLFCPVVASGSHAVNLWWPGPSDALPVLVLSLGSGALVVLRRYTRSLFITGALALGTVLWDMAIIAHVWGDPLLWGWGVLILGAVLVLATPLIPSRDTR